MRGSFKGRDFLTLQDYTTEELLSLLQLSMELKRDPYKLGKPLQGKHVALIFEKPSTRTRVSLEVAVSQLGGKTIYLSSTEMQLARGETIADTARVMDRYVDAVAARVRSHQWLVDYAKYSTKPVINALSDLYHPMQALADLMTIWEELGRLQGVKVAYVGDGGANTCHSLLIACSKLGLDMTVACPPEYSPKPEVLSSAMQNASISGSRIAVVSDPVEAVKGADVIYTDVFVSMGKEDEALARRAAFMPRYQVNKELLSLAKDSYIFMHCLPAHRGEEVTDEVIDDEVHSAVWVQAENRLHTAKAILSLLL
mgnify:CR=1 FL=1